MFGALLAILLAAGGCSSPALSSGLPAGALAAAPMALTAMAAYGAQSAAVEAPVVLAAQVRTVAAAETMTSTTPIAMPKIIATGAQISPAVTSTLTSTVTCHRYFHSYFHSRLYCDGPSNVYPRTECDFHRYCNRDTDGDDAAHRYGRHFRYFVAKPDCLSYGHDHCHSDARCAHSGRY